MARAPASRRRKEGAAEIAASSDVRPHFVAVRPRRDDGLDRGVRFRLELASAVIHNVVSRRALAGSFERILFGADQTAIDFVDLPTRCVPLTASNVSRALLASGSIPLVMAGVRGIPGVAGPSSTAKIPDRSDFLKLPTADRIRRWRQVLDRSRRFADEPVELFEGRGRDFAPLPG